MIQKLKPTLLELLLLTIITVPAILILLNTSYFTMHDDQHIVRLHLLHQGLLQGNIYPRWVDGLGFGFGYPLFNFYPPLIYYVAEFLHLIGFSLITSTKLMIASGFIIGSLGMFLLAKRFMGRAAGFLAVTLYTYFTYHAVLVYVRGALAEFFAYSLLPWVFLALYKLVEAPSMKRAILFGMSFALLILCHPLIALPALFYIIFFLIFYIIFGHPERSEGSRSNVSLGRIDDAVARFLDKLGMTYHYFLGLLLGLCLSAFFWLPSFFERKFTLVDSILTKELASYNIHFVYPQQLWYSPWGYGGSAAGLSDGMSYQLGKIHLIFFVVAFALSFIYWHLVKKERLKHFYFFSAMLLFSLFMTTSYSIFIWRAIPPLSFLQFPWRFLTFAGIFISLCGGFVIYFISHIWESLNTKTILTVLALTSSFIVIFQYHKYFTPQKFIQTTDQARTSYEEIAWRISRTSYEFVPKGVITKKTELGTTTVDIEKKDLPKKPYNIISGTADVKTVKNNFNKKIFQISSNEPIAFRLNTYNFPGWKSVIASGAKQSPKSLQISDSNKYKLITVNIPQGKHIVEFRFENTPVRTYGNLISVITLFVLLIYFVRRKYIV